MKLKLVALTALFASSVAFAGSATFEYQDIDGKKNTPQDQTSWSVTVKEQLAKGLVGDVGLSQTNNKNSGADTLASTRTEAGLTASTTLGLVSPYVRGAIGEKYNSSTNFGYYSVEPGATVGLGRGFTAKLGWRYREAFNSVNNDTTRTLRAGVAYDLTKTDQIGVRYDRMRGDFNQNIVAVNYTRSF